MKRRGSNHGHIIFDDCFLVGVMRWTTRLWPSWTSTQLLPLTIHKIFALKKCPSLNSVHSMDTIGQRTSNFDDQIVSFHKCIVVIAKAYWSIDSDLVNIQISAIFQIPPDLFIRLRKVIKEIFLFVTEALGKTSLVNDLQTNRTPEHEPVVCRNECEDVCYHGHTSLYVVRAFSH